MARYHPYSEFLKSHFGERVQKISLDAGFTCPNRDGTVATGGCIFCAQGSRAHYVNPALSVRDQLDSGIAQYKKKHKVDKFIAYFQAYTNTHGPLDFLHKVFSEALSHPNVVGLSVGTRPDCLGNDVLDMLSELAGTKDKGHGQAIGSRQRYFLLEIGIPSLDDEVLRWANRGHTTAIFFDAVGRAVARGLRVCAHVILGLPGETVSSVVHTARALSDAGIDGVKIHNLHVIRGTPLESIYLRGKCPMISQEEYVTHVRHFLENLKESVWIHRLTGEAPKDMMLAPDWAFHKQSLLAAIHREMDGHDSIQGMGC